jgi:BASS family bile acid:Na+ symporter
MIMIAFYLEYEYWFAATQLFLAMLGMGATLAPKDFHEVIREPKAVSIGIVMQLIIVPLIALLLIITAGFPPAIIVGVALIAAIPGGTTSNVFVHLAKGNTPLSITITAITTLACLLTTPYLLELLIAEYMPQNFIMPFAQIAFEITVCLLVPLLLGMLVFRFSSHNAATFSTWCVRLTLLVIVFIVLGSIGAGRLNLEIFGTDNLLRMIGFFLLLAIVANLLPRVMGLNREDRISIEMEVVVRNINLGLLLNVSLFPASNPTLAPIGNIVLFCLLLFGSLQMLLGAVLVGNGRRNTQ